MTVEQSASMGTGGTQPQPGDQSAQPGGAPVDTAAQSGAGLQPAGDKANENAGGKPGENAGVESEYKLDVPKDVAVDQADLDAFTSLVKDAKVSPETAQKLLDFEVKRLQAAQEKLAATVQQWRDEIKADKEIGGDKLDENLSVARKVFQTYFDPDTVKMAAISGFGDHPGVVRGFIKLAKALSEDTLHAAGGAPKSGSRPASDEDLALQMFPSMRQN